MDGDLQAAAEEEEGRDRCRVCSGLLTLGMQPNDRGRRRLFLGYTPTIVRFFLLGRLSWSSCGRLSSVT